MGFIMELAPLWDLVFEGLCALHRSRQRGLCEARDQQPIPGKYLCNMLNLNSAIIAGFQPL